MEGRADVLCEGVDRLDCAIDCNCLDRLVHINVREDMRELVDRIANTLHPTLQARLVDRLAPLRLELGLVSRFGQGTFDELRSERLAVLIIVRGPKERAHDGRVDFLLDVIDRLFECCKLHGLLLVGDLLLLERPEGTRPLDALLRRLRHVVHAVDCGVNHVARRLHHPLDRVERVVVHVGNARDHSLNAATERRGGPVENRTAGVAHLVEDFAAHRRRSLRPVWVPNRGDA